MNRGIKAHYEKILGLLAGAILLASAGWLWLRDDEIRRLRTEPVAVQLSGSRYEPPGLKRSEVALPVWTNPVGQSHGDGWRYEVFTPPVVYYNPSAKTFTVIPPSSGLPAREAPWGVELVDVKFEPYRLQLVGYFGGPGDYVAAFSSSGSSDILLARIGHRFAQFGLVLKDFAVKKIPVEHDDMWPVFDVAALAVLRDETTDSDVVLDSRARKFTDTPLAVCKFAASDPKLRELRQGETLSAGGSVYRVDRIQLSPPEVAVTRQSADLAQSETKILHPVALPERSTAALPAKSISAPLRSVAKLTTNSK